MVKQIHRTEVEEIHEESGTTDFDVSVTRKGGITGASELHSELQQAAGSFEVSGFKCSHDECGLVHGHHTTKHRASDSFDMSDDEAAGMEANCCCHCGLNQLARDGEIPMDASEANRKAPIPESMSLHIDSQ